LIAVFEKEERNDSKNQTDKTKQTASPRNAQSLVHRFSSKRQHHGEQAARARSCGDGTCRENFVRVDEVVSKGDEDEQVCHAERYGCEDRDNPMYRGSCGPAKPEHGNAKEGRSKTGERDSTVFFLGVPGWLWDFFAGAVEVDVPEEEDAAGYRAADADGEKGETAFACVEAVDAGVNDRVGLEEHFGTALVCMFAGWWH